MTCHNGLPEHEPFTPAHYDAVPLGITCERCHGPGSEHVERHLAGLVSRRRGTREAKSIPASSTRLASTRDGQLAVCQQCHLTGTSVFGAR